MKSILTKEIIKRRFSDTRVHVPPKGTFNSLVNQQPYTWTVNKFATRNVVNQCRFKSFPDPYISSIQFMAWQDNTVSEANRNVWMQFWIALDVCDYICMIVDSRNIDFFFEEEILEIGKPLILIINKYDLGRESAVSRKVMQLRNRIFRIFKFSSIDQKVNDEFLLFLRQNGNRKYAMIGYPNVGKSTLIKIISNHVKIKISNTPGKTKFVQAYKFTGIVFLDVPGLVFKRHSREELLIYNIVNVDQSKIDYEKLYVLILQRVSLDKILNHFKIKECTGTFDGLILAIEEQRKWSKERFFRTLLKNYFTGKLA